MMRTPLFSALAVGFAVSLAFAQQARSALTLQEASRAYFTDPVGGAASLIDAARGQPIDELAPLQGLLLSDAAIRLGHLDLARAVAFSVRQRASDPGMAGLAEVLLAWIALARGRLTQAHAHLDAAGIVSSGLRPVTDPATGLVAVVRGSPDGLDIFFGALAHPGVDSAWIEVGPLLDAYVRYWAGDALGAIDGFEAFASANPGSRFADDALYAAAQAKRRAGLREQADADLEALAGDGPKPLGVSRRLIALDSRAVLLEGMRRDRERGTRSVPRRFADLFDGDGIMLARAALHRHPPRDPAGMEPLTSSMDRSGIAKSDRVRIVSTSRGTPSPGPIDRADRVIASGDTPDERPAARHSPVAWLAAAAILLALLALAKRRSSHRRG